MSYPKLNKVENCAHPERKECNYSDIDNSIKRCEYMKYDNLCSIFDTNRWKCIYKRI
jgi:hypothetical protein